MKNSKAQPKEINVLPPSVFNLLAAGEVVENPASIVKETVENSLDAGAREITVSITGGGIDEICVTDDGYGITADQISKVFLPHATSKVKTAADLESIGTLGFRGEALSSIASVSRTELVSRAGGDSLGSQVQSDGSLRRTSANPGTQITVRSLFYNTPARKKFLMNARMEQNNVTGVVQKLILSNPSVSFKYIIDGQLFYDFRGDGLSSAIDLIYGKVELVPVKAKRRDLGLAGYISPPGLTKKNRTWQTVIVNGRAVEGGTVAKAANAAYSNYLAAGVFPVFVLALAVDGGDVDVNVHPRKAQVKFSQEAEVFEFVRSAVTDAIDDYFHKQLTINKEQGTENIESITGYDNAQQLLDNIKFLASSSPKTGDGKPLVQSAPRVLSLLQKAEETKVARMHQYAANKEKAVQGQMTAVTGVGLDVKVLGGLFDTYILLAGGEYLQIIDQHAAQERLLYDQLTKQIDSGAVATQILAEPAILYLTPAELNKMEIVAPVLGSMGIECEIFGGNCFRITAVPVAVSERGIDTIIGNVLRDIRGVSDTRLSALLREKVITECCKSAIKAGQSLTNDQIRYFLEQFKKTKMTPLCPHGRPIIVNLTKAQIEKMFARK